MNSVVKPLRKFGCGGVLLSHTLSSAVPLPCQVLASGFGMIAGRFPWAMTTAKSYFLPVTTSGLACVVVWEPDSRRVKSFSQFGLLF